MKKRYIFLLMVVFLLLFSSSANAYYSGYPINNITKNDIKNRYFQVYIWDNATSTWNYLGNKLGTETLATGLYVYEHASHSSTYNILYSPIVIASTNYLAAWTNMRNEMGPITVLAGYRNIRHNKAISGAAQYSQHQAGNVSDRSKCQGVAHVA